MTTRDREVPARIRSVALKGSSFLALLTCGANALAQADTPPDSTQESESLEEVVVTGVPYSEGQRKLDVSFSISTATEEEIRQTAPIGTADLLKIVPGVWVESTGGTTASNVFVRGFPSGGDAPYLSVQMNGSPLYPPPTLSFMENTSLFRLDDTVERVEVLRGGPSPIFSNGQPGATANFILKEGTPEPEASVRATIGSEGLYRGDFVLQGPLAEETSFMLGGYYLQSDGLRDTQFPANRGGQLTGSIRHHFENGEVSFYARRLDDENTVYIGLPLRSTNGKLSNYPGFDALRDTLVGNDIRRVSIEIAPGATPVTKSLDSADGRKTALTNLGTTFDFAVGEFRISNRVSYLDGSFDTTALFTGPNPTSLDAFIDGQITAANGNPAVVAAAGGPATSATARFANGGAGVTGSQQVIQAGIWSVEKQLRSFTDELRVSREIFDSNTLTIGAYYADYSADDLWYLGNNALLTAEPNARLIDVALDNDVAVTRAGFTGSPFFDVNASYNGRNVAAFLADDWQLTPALRVDAGVRWEEQTTTGSLENIGTSDLDGDPTTLYNNNATILNGTYRTLDFEESKVAWTAGLNYSINRNLSVFTRANSGFAFPQFDNLRDGLTVVQTVKQYELGLKSVTRSYEMFLTGFYNRFEGLPFQQFVVNPDGTSSNVARIGGSRAYGLEFEGALKPFDGALQIGIRGVLQDAKFVDFGVNTDNEVARQPSFLVSVRPSYDFATSFGALRAFVDVTYVGERFSDIENQQPLDSYETVAIGASLNMDDRVTLQATVENLTNTLALTEGNARVIGSGNSGGTLIGRPIFGRHATVTAAYKF